MDGRKSLVLFSGGLDSFLSLLTAKEDGGEIKALFFNYGQNPIAQERSAVYSICEKLNIPFTEIDLTHLAELLQSPYTTGKGADEGGTYLSYVPNRNLLFLTLASNYAFINGFNRLYSGFYFKDGKTAETLKGNDLNTRIDNAIEEADREQIKYTLHSDQTREFIELVGNTLKISNDSADIELINPLADLDKVDIYDRLGKLGYLQMAIEDTFSCYADSAKLNYWGRGCGVCGSCVGRKKSYDVLKKNYNGLI